MNAINIQRWALKLMHDIGNIFTPTITFVNRHNTNNNNIDRLRARDFSRYWLDPIPLTVIFWFVYVQKLGNMKPTVIVVTFGLALALMLRFRLWLLRLHLPGCVRACVCVCLPFLPKLCHLYICFGFNLLSRVHFTKCPQNIFNECDGIIVCIKEMLQDMKHSTVEKS